jgi:hypothetical protein
MYGIMSKVATKIRTYMFVFQIRTGETMPDAKDEWAEKAKAYLKTELKKDKVGYADLARRLTEMGIVETEGSVTVKINRAAFPAWFMMAALKTLGRTEIKID